MVPAVKPLIVRLYDPVVITGDVDITVPVEIVGLADVEYTIPLAVIVAFPSDVIFPPLIAEVVLIEETLAVVRAGAVTAVFS